MRFVLRADRWPGPKARLAFALTRAAGKCYAVLRGRGRASTRGEIRSILVSRRGRLGDFVVVLPMLGSLRARYPLARIVVGVHTAMPARALFGGSELVDEVRVLDHLSRPTLVGRLRGVLALFLEGFDAVVSGESFALIEEVFYCGAPLLVGLDDGHPLQRWNGWRVPCDPSRSAAENHLALAEVLDARPEPGRRAPRLELPGSARAAGGSPALPEAPFVVLHPGAQKPSRRWPAPNFAELARRILEARPELRLVFSGTRDEVSLVDGIVGSLPDALRARCADRAGRTDLAGLVELLDAAGVLVCNDTGVMHVARARGTPLVALLGPENDRYWGPHPGGWGPAVAIRHVVPCAPCTRWDCDALHCMRSLTPAEAFAAVSLLLDRPGSLERGRDAGAWPDRGTADLPLVRIVQRHDWRDLAHAGFAIPLVSVVRLDPAVAPDLVAWSAFASELALAPAPAAVAWERASVYPNVESLHVTRNGVGSGAEANSWAPAGLACTDPCSAWSAITDAVRGELVAVLRSEEAELDLGPCVAALMRSPALDGIATSDGARVVRRAALARIVAEARPPACARARPAGGSGMAVTHGS